MKYFTLTLITGTLLLMSSCKNIEKMVDKGEYDKAINYAVSKLEGQKKKKTKYVKALEKAYAKINSRDMATIYRLESGNNPDKYDKIYSIYTQLDERQNTVHRLVPLVSEQGYEAHLPFVDYTPVLSDIAIKAAESHYQEANRLLKLSYTHDKYAAREAYHELGVIEQYSPNYKDVDSLFVKAYERGVDHITIELHSNTFMPYALENELQYIDLSSINDFWTQYYINPPPSIKMDYAATLEIDQVLPGKEREYYTTYTESKEIKSGLKEVVDTNGNVVKDTLGNTIYTDNLITVTAEINELHREKVANIIGRLTLYHIESNSLVTTTPLEIVHHFEDHAATYRGDERAITNSTKRKLKARCDNFPSDYDILRAMSMDFRDNVISLLRHSRVR